MKSNPQLNMPRGQNRQTNAHSRALETISNTIVADPQEETSEVTPTATVLNLPQQQPAQETAEEQPKPRKKAQEPEATDSDFKKQPGEDFFEYVNRIPLEAFTANGAGLYIYKQAQQGNVQIDKIYRPLAFDELKNIYAAKNGAGNYYVQFNTRDKKFSSMGQRYTFDGDNLSLLGEAAGTVLGNTALVNPQQSATAEAIKIIAEASREANKANIELIKDHAKKPEEGTAITALIIKMMDAQRIQDVERAEKDRTEAKEQAKRDIEAAKERAERDQKFFQLMIDNSEKRANERAEMMKLMNEQQGKFFETMLKAEKEKQPFGMDLIKNLFSAFAQERLEGGGNDMLPGWAGVAQTIIPKIAEAIPAFMAARNGATPQQIAQIQEQQRLAAAQQETAHGANGGLRQQNPAEPKLITTEDSLKGFIDRLGTYLAKKLQEGKPADPAYMMTAMEEEYELVADLMYHNQKEAIIQTIANAPLGQQLLQIPTASAFIDELINRIKQPEPDDDEEQEIILATPDAGTSSISTSSKRKNKVSN